MPQPTIVYCTRAFSMTALVVFIAASSAVAQRKPEPSEWDQGGRLRAYRVSLVGPAALVGVGITTAVDHARDDPPEWGEAGQNGLARRTASNLGRMVVTQTVRHGLANVM